MKFVPDELQKKNSPCWLIALNEKGETIDYLDRCGTQHELEEALTGWLRSQITRIDQQLATSTRPLLEEYGELSKFAQTNLEKPVTFWFGLRLPTRPSSPASVVTHFDQTPGPPASHRVSLLASAAF